MILMKDIVREGHPALKMKSEEVELPLSKEMEKTLVEMNDYLINSNDPKMSEKYGLRAGCGLAANQINVLKRMLVMRDYDEDQKWHHYMMINPKIIGYSDELVYLPGGEGCLSVDREVTGLVHRPKKVTVITYLYEDGAVRKVTLKLKDYIALVFQHEFDHLNGIMFTDRISKETPLRVPENSTPVEIRRPEDEQKKSPK